MTDGSRWFLIPPPFISMVSFFFAGGSLNWIDATSLASCCSKVLLLLVWVPSRSNTPRSSRFSTENFPRRPSCWPANRRRWSGISTRHVETHIFSVNHGFKMFQVHTCWHHFWFWNSPSEICIFLCQPRGHVKIVGVEDCILAKFKKCAHTAISVDAVYVCLCLKWTTYTAVISTVYMMVSKLHSANLYHTISICTHLVRHFSGWPTFCFVACHGPVLDARTTMKSWASPRRTCQQIGITYQLVISWKTWKVSTTTGNVFFNLPIQVFETGWTMVDICSTFPCSFWWLSPRLELFRMPQRRTSSAPTRSWRWSAPSWTRLEDTELVKVEPQSHTVL